MRVSNIVLILLAAAFLTMTYKKYAGEGTLPQEAAADGNGLRLSPEILEKLRQTAMDLSPEVRWAAISLLYQVRDPKISILLTRSLKQETDPKVRKNILEVLNQNRDPKTLPALFDSLADTEKDVRIAALIAIGNIGEPIHIAQVARALYDTDPEVKLQAIHTMEKLHQKGLQKQEKRLFKKNLMDYISTKGE